MIGGVAAKYAMRSLRRHTRRTALAMVGVGVGVGVGIVALSWFGGGADMQVRAASESGAGHLRVVPNSWVETRENSLRLPEWRAIRERVLAQPNVRVATARARIHGLLAFGNRSCGLEITGVTPAEEAQANRIVSRSRLEGRYLEPADRGVVVVGAGVARRLDVELDDDLYVTVSGRDEIRGAMLRIVGILSTGSPEFDTAFCHVSLPDVEELCGYPGAGEITILLHDHTLIPTVRDELAGAVGNRVEVITWKEVNRPVAANIEGDRAFMRMLVGIIVLVVSLGIASAQLTAVLERKHEFAVLTALGMKPRQVMVLVLLEGLLIGVGGALCALLLGGGSAYWLHTRGVNIAALMGGEDMSFANMLMDPYIFGSFGPWIVWCAFGTGVTATLAASLYPAILATRAEPAEALRM